MRRKEPGVKRKLAYGTEKENEEQMCTQTPANTVENYLEVQDNNKMVFEIQVFEETIVALSDHKMFKCVNSAYPCIQWTELYNLFLP